MNDDRLMQQLLQGGMMDGPKPLVEFKAGRMDYDGRMVTPDRRRGLLRVIKDPHGMTTFQFCDADTKNSIESFFVFADEAKFEKVKQTDDRVYLLEMRDTKQRFFYWMQVRSNLLEIVCIGG
jgi:26S proteasome regulatory subunit N13